MKSNNFLKKSGCIILIVFLAFNMGTYTSCIAATSSTQIEKINTVSTIKDTKKVWSIKFNKDIDENSIKSNIYIVDGSNNKVNTSLKLLRRYFKT